MPLPIYKLTELSWTELEELDKDNTCALVPLSPIEEHGPHLPLGTDILAARDIAGLAAQYACEQTSSLQIVMTPSIPLGCAGVTADIPGTISLRGKTLYNLILDLCSGLANSGFQYAVIVNHHLDPVHMKAILEGIEAVCRTYSIRVIETAGSILFSGMELQEHKLIKEMGLSLTSEIHADVRETSFISYCYPHLLKNDPKILDSVTIDPRKEMAAGKTTFKAMGAEHGYIGSPANASKSLGKLHIEEHARIIADLILRLINRQPLPEIQPNILQYYKKHVQL